jgi:hypothetical protein
VKGVIDEQQEIFFRIENLPERIESLLTSQGHTLADSGGLREMYEVAGKGYDAFTTLTKRGYLELRDVFWRRCETRYAHRRDRREWIS